MSHRPYPDARRALRQLDRHTPAAVREPSKAELAMARQMAAALAAVSVAARPFVEAQRQAVTAVTSAIRRSLREAVSPPG